MNRIGNIRTIKAFLIPAKIIMITIVTMLFADVANAQMEMNSRSNKKEKLYLHLSLPFINSFCMKFENKGANVKTGFFGVSAGLDYHHSKNQFVHLSASSVTHLFSIPKSNGELMTSEYISLSNNHIIERFTIGYGFSYGTNQREKWENGWGWLSLFPTDSEKHHVFGLTFPTYFRLTKLLNVGIVYRPTFYRPTSAEKFSYEHVISFDFAFKIRII